MTILRVPQRVMCAIVIPIYRVSTLNVLPLATVRWMLVTIISIPCQTFQAFNSLTDKGLRDDLYMSIPRRMSTTPISKGVLHSINEY